MPVKLCNDWCLPVPASSASVLEIARPVPEPPLSIDEVMACLRQRWRATYDLQLVVRRRRLYLQVMWAYLEQQSFPMDLEAYRQHLGEVLDVVNRLGLAGEVRQWMGSTRDKPRLGKALSLPLEATGPEAETLIKEFLV
ncbi:DUF3067 family protein [Synechococcus sp. A15-62]|uniref:DUF3067 family protein n=1 Tax=Synechococcus sp. A15-62 TaxID=1050657 RepID=UPI0016457C5B|nr:DUF3067 family protein [Synechococcus sp. A15-62]